MTRTPYESATGPMSHNATDPAELNVVCRSSLRAKSVIASAHTRESMFHYYLIYLAADSTWKKAEITETLLVSNQGAAVKGFVIRNSTVKTGLP